MAGIAKTHWNDFTRKAEAIARAKLLGRNGYQVRVFRGRSKAILHDISGGRTIRRYEYVVIAKLPSVKTWPSIGLWYPKDRVRIL